MSDNGVAHTFNLIYRHVRIGGQGQIIRLETLVYKTVDGVMHLLTHRLNHDAIDSIVMALAGCLQRIQARDVALLCLLAHGQQLVGETTHGRNDDHDRPLLGLHNIPEVKQALDATHRGTPKFHHFHYCPLFSVISLIN